MKEKKHNSSFVSQLHRAESQKLCGYLFVFEHIGANLSSAFGSVVAYVLKYGHEDFQHLVFAVLCKLIPQCLLPSSLAASILQSLEGF